MGGLKTLPKCKVCGKRHTVSKARKEFLKAVKAVNEGKADKNTPIPGQTGEVHGQSRMKGG